MAPVLGEPILPTSIIPSRDRPPSCPPMPLIARTVAPGAAASSWLADEVSRSKGGDALQPVTVLTTGYAVGLHVRRNLSVAGLINVRCTTLAGLSERLAARRLAAQGLTLLDSARRDAAIREAVRADEGPLGALGTHPSVTATLRGFFVELGRRRADEQLLAELSAGDSAIAAAAVRVYRGYRTLLDVHRLCDDVRLMDEARAAVAEMSSAPRDLGPVIAHLAEQLPVAARELLTTLATITPVTLGVTAYGDDVGDRLVSDLREHFTVVNGAADGAPGPAPASIELGTAPDAADEVRAVVRRILAATDEHAAPLHRTAIVYHDTEPYRVLVREMLSAADVPSAALDGEPLTTSRMGSMLLALLRLREQDFSRPAVVGWMSSLAARTPGTSALQWEALSREAGIVRGVAEWSRRLKQLISRHQATLAEGDPESAQATFLRGVIADATAMAATIAELDAHIDPPHDGTWRELVHWARGLRDRYIPVSPAWSSEDTASAQLVDDVLSGLAAADAIESHPDVHRFIGTLEQALTSQTQSGGVLGRHVLTGPLAAIQGMHFDTVYIVGVSERSFPSSAPDDPLFTGTDPLDLARTRATAERRAFLSACHAATTVRLSHPRRDRAGRPIYPSPWVADVAAVTLAASPGIDDVLTDPATATWATVAERRTAAALRARRTGTLTSSAIAQRGDLPLSRAICVQRARHSSAFTEFDGNLAAIAADSTRLGSGLESRVHSPSALESWATCPFRYFLKHVLRIREIDRPEFSHFWSTEPRHLGTLHHKILEVFFARLAADGRPGPHESYSADDRALVSDIVDAECALLESRGLNGHPLVWAEEKRRVRADMLGLLIEDEVLRQAFVPVGFEQRFGFPHAESWPPVALELPSGTVRIRGVIDRVDVLGDRNRPAAVRVIDYKTGKKRPPAPEAANGLAAGTKLQLAIYAAAVEQQASALGHEVPPVTGMYWHATAKNGYDTQVLEFTTDVAASLRTVLTTIDSGIRSGCAVAVPGEYSERTGRQTWDNCAYCPYDRACPTGRDAVHRRKQGNAVADIHASLSRSAAPDETQ